nr:exosortase H [Acidovorax sp. 94]
MIFIAVLAVLFRIDMLDEVQRVAIEPWTSLLATASAALMTPLDSDVAHHGRILMSKATGFAVSIEAGCNGVEAAIILIAGMIAFPSSWKHKLAGIAIGIAAVQVVNLLRIISLYYLGKWNMTVFEFAHLYLWQALIMLDVLDVLVVWMLWIRWIARQQPPSPPQPPLANAA